MNKVKRLSILLFVFISIVLIVIYNKSSYTIKFAPKKGREYKVSYNVNLQSEDEAISIKNNFNINLKCINIKQKKTYIEVKYNDYVVETKENGISIKVDEDSEIFGESVSKLKTSKFKGYVYEKSNFLKYNLISGDENVLGDSTLNIEEQQEKLIEIITCFVGENVKNDSNVNVNLEKILGKDICKNINLKDTNINGKVKAIKNNIALIELNNNDNKKNNVKIKLSSQVNINTGMIRYMKVDIDDKSKDGARKTFMTDIFIEEE